MKVSHQDAHDSLASEDSQATMACLDAPIGSFHAADQCVFRVLSMLNSSRSAGHDRTTLKGFDQSTEHETPWSTSYGINEWNNRQHVHFSAS